MALLFLATLLLAAQAAPLLPNADPFYQPPAGYASTALGTVLRYRPINATNIGSTNLTAAYQLLYRTQSINGSALATVTTVLVPQNATTDRFVSFQLAEDSAFINCAPSYNIQNGTTATNPNGNGQFSDIEAYLSTGLIVAMPDHEGPDAAFAAGRLEGYLTLDGMRAVSNYMGNKPMIVGAAYSGGSIANGWAASLQPSYAPELPVKAWTLGGTPGNLTSTLLYIDRGSFAGFQPDLLVGLNQPSSYQAILQPVYSKYVTALGNNELNTAATNCVAADIITFFGNSILAYTFQTLGPAFIYQKDFAGVLAKQTMGVNTNETPTAPVLLYHSTGDEIIPYNIASTLYSSWCAKGGSVHFATYTAGGHFSTEGYGLVPAIKYAMAGFAGTIPQGCSTETISNLTIDTDSFGPRSEDALFTVLNTALQVGNN